MAWNAIFAPAARFLKLDSAITVACTRQKRSSFFYAAAANNTVTSPTSALLPASTSPFSKKQCTGMQYMQHRDYTDRSKKKGRSYFSGNPYWAQRYWYHLQVMHQYWNEEITPANLAFVQDHITEQFKQQHLDSPLKHPPAERAPYHSGIRRAGLICRKIHVQRQWLADGRKTLCTLLQVADNHVLRSFSPEEYKKTSIGLRHGKGKWGCVALGADSIDPTLLTKEYLGLFTESGVQPKRRITRFTVTREGLLEPGTPLYASHFKVGQYVDIAGVTMWKGFQGGMKRWGMKGGKGGKAARTKNHRRIGSIGFSRHAGRVWRGKKMPGWMGGGWRTQRGYKIVRIDHAENVIYVRGDGVPGVTNAYVQVRDTDLPLKKPKADMQLPVPTFYPDDDPPRDVEEYHQDLFRLDSPTIVYQEEILKKKVIAGSKAAKKATSK